MINEVNNVEEDKNIEIILDEMHFNSVLIRMLLATDITLQYLLK